VPPRKEILKHEKISVPAYKMSFLKDNFSFHLLSRIALFLPALFLFFIYTIKNVWHCRHGFPSFTVGATPKGAVDDGCTVSSGARWRGKMDK
jgi:hypothetical protein